MKLCANGKHLMTPENTITRKHTNWKECKACARDRERRRYERKRLADVRGPYGVYPLDWPAPERL